MKDNHLNNGATNEIYTFPISYAQQRLWFLHQLDPDAHAYNIPAAFRLNGPVNAAALEKSVQEVVRRHEILRTTFSLLDGEPKQIVAAGGLAGMSIVDLGSLPEPEREDELRRRVAEETKRCFDLEKGPLFQVSLLLVDDEESVLIISMHHIISDGWSIPIFFRELAISYEAFSKHKTPVLTEMPIQYADYAIWQRERLRGDFLEEQVSYWKKQLEGITGVLNLPTDRPRPSRQSFRGSSQSLEFSRELTDRLKALSQKQGVTLFMTLLAAFQALLYRYTGQEDIVVGSPIANRTRTEVEGLIGFFVNTLVLRANFAGNPTFRELLGRVRNTALDAYEHQDLPFEKLVEELQPERSLSYSPLFQVMFVLQNAPSMGLELEGLSVSRLRVGAETAKFDLTLSMHETVEGLRGSLQYNTDLFDDATITRILGHFATLLEGIVKEPTRCVSDLPILTEAEKQQLLVEWNDTKRDYPKDTCIHQLFEAQVEKTPNAAAVVFENQQFTYADLNRRANQLAHCLQKLGVGPETLVGICMERSLEMIVGLLGILKAGGAYVPLDPDYPKGRLEFMLEDAKVCIVLTDASSRSSLLPTNVSVICLDEHWEAVVKESQVNPMGQITADRLAHVIYTSGSTGVPKGVKVRHQGVVRLLFGIDYVQLSSAQTILHLAPISFDAATFEVWGALLHGGKCVLFPGKVPGANELGAILKKHHVNTLWLPAALFNTVINEAPQGLSGVRQLLIGGEALSVPHVRKALSLLPNTEIINGYGPTESTTFTCCYSIPCQLNGNSSSVPIGKPIGNTQIYILDPQLNPVPIGVAGELYIGGAGLGRGYLNRPELTAETFVANPFSITEGARLYKSGDLARYLPDGNIEFLGRIDQQVKVRGYRIELGEIEVVLGQHPAVKESVVLVREDSSGDRRLVAYVVPVSGFDPKLSEMRSYFRQKLPEYMLPSAYVLLDSLPLTLNGKLDRRELPVPRQDTREGDRGYVAPVKTVEHQLTQIWEDLLGVRPIGILDNFFDLGGHSLLAVQMMHRVEEVCGARVPLSTLLVAPTVESLGKALVQQRLEESGSPVVKVQSGGDKQPLFFLHGEFRAGGIFCFNLARGLGKDQPFYALTPHGLNRQPDTVPRTVEAMAAAYIEAVRTVQPEGPYLLGGFCNGGTVAFEMARQLHGCGQKVDLVVLIAAQGRNAPSMRILQCLTDGVGYLLGLKSEKKISQFVVLRYYIRRMKQMAQLPLGEQLAWALCLAKKRIWGVTRSFAAAGLPRECVGPDQAGQHENWEEDRLIKIYHRALENYVPRPYSGRVVLFCPTEEYPANPKDPTMGWGKAAPNIEVQMVPGDHVTCITRYVKTLADRMKACLDQAQGNG